MTEPAHPPFPFIVARGRSGTTLLRAMFDAHPEMAIPDESHFIVQFARHRARYREGAGFDIERYQQDLLDHWAFRRWGLPETAVREALAAHPPADLAAAIRTTFGAYARARGKVRSGDKTPINVLHIDLLADLFREAVFIHVIRDGRDVALSYLSTDFGAKTLGQSAIQWDRFVRAGRSAGGVLGDDRYREVRYEELIREPRKVLEELCSFVGLGFDERMLRYHERADELVPTLGHTDHHQNLYKPPTVGLRDWRLEMSTADVAVFQSIAGELLDELGYERADVPVSLGTTMRARRYRAGTAIRRVAHGARTRSRRLGRRITQRAPDPASLARPHGSLSGERP